MTDVTPPRGPSGPSDERAGAGDELTPDELASGYLDSELAPDERARVEADPALMALVAELRTVSDAVASPVAPLTDDRRAAMLAAAAAAAALPAAGTATGVSEGAAAGTVTSLDAARRQRSTRLVRIVAGGLAAAAAVGLLALVVTRGPGSSDVDTADGADAETATFEANAGGGAADTTAAGTAAADAAPADTSAQAAAGSEAPSTEAPAAATEDAATSAAPPRSSPAAATGGALPDLGPLANRREARAATEAFTFVDALAAAGGGPCADYPPPVATATFQGAPAYVVIIETAPDGNRLAFLDQATCAVLVKVDPANV